MRKQRVMLKYYPDIPKMRRFCCNVGAFDEHPAVGWRGETRNATAESRFAAATEAEKANKLAGWHVKGKPLKRGNIAVDLGHFAQGNGRLLRH
jgi:hypothetical protein